MVAGSMLQVTMAIAGYKVRLNNKLINAIASSGSYIYAGIIRAFIYQPIMELPGRIMYLKVIRLFCSCRI